MLIAPNLSYSSTRYSYSGINSLHEHIYTRSGWRSRLRSISLGRRAVDSSLRIRCLDIRVLEVLPCKLDDLVWRFVRSLPETEQSSHACVVLGIGGSEDDQQRTQVDLIHSLDNNAGTDTSRHIHRQIQPYTWMMMGHLADESCSSNW